MIRRVAATAIISFGTLVVCSRGEAWAAGSRSGTSGTITIDSATYGSVTKDIYNPQNKCATVTPGNATQVVQSACGGQPSCGYTVNTQTFPGGDPAPGCWKNFVIQYDCSDGSAVRTISVGGLSGEADGQTLYLDCTPNTGINVISATFGGQTVAKWATSCPSVPSGNWTAMVQSQCFHMQQCPFLVQVTDFPSGDPAPGCYKSFTASYSCAQSSAPIKQISIPATANGGADGQTVSLWCSPPPSGNDIQVTQLSTVTASNLYAVTRGPGGRFVAVGDNGTNIQSDDGVTWTVNSPISGVSKLKSVAASSSTFVAVGLATALPGSNMFSSADGSVWFPAHIFSLQWDTVNYSSVAAGGMNFIATGGDSAGTYYSALSQTGAAASWTNQYLYPISTSPINSVAWTNNTIVAVGPTVFTSGNGANWGSYAPGVFTLYSVAWDGGQYIGVGYGGAIVTSPTGAVWTVQSSGVTQNLGEVACSGGGTSGWCVAIAQGVLLTSSDGVTWTSHPSLAQSGIEAVIWDGTGFLAVGDSGKMLRISRP